MVRDKNILETPKQIPKSKFRCRRGSPVTTVSNQTSPVPFLTSEELLKLKEHEEIHHNKDGEKRYSWEPVFSWGMFYKGKQLICTTCNKIIVSALLLPLAFFIEIR